MSKKYEFESERLGFRQWIDEDRIPFAKINSNQEVMKYFTKQLTEEESDKFIERISEHFKVHGYGLWAVEIKESSQFIGFIGFYTATFESAFTPCIEIGWRLDHNFWNMGYATEGAKKCLEFGLNKLGLVDIYSFTSQINEPSIRVMKKIGLIEMGTFPHSNIDDDNPLKPHVLYKIDKARYKGGEW